MKDGAGTDPFADSGEEDPSDPETESVESVDVETNGSSIPWYFRRQTVSDGRDAVNSTRESRGLLHTLIFCNKVVL